MQINESELRSLAQLRIPRSLRLPNERSSPCLVGHQSGLLGSLKRVLYLLFHLSSSHNPRIPVLEGKRVFRSGQDQRVILAVGEDVSFSHLPGVGTEWRTESKSYSELLPKAFFVELLLRVEIAFPAILPRFLRSLWKNYFFPFPPPPLREQRKLLKLGLSPQMARVMRLSPSLILQPRR